MFGSTRDYGLRPGSGSSGYTASGIFSSGYSGLMGGIGALNPFGRRSNSYLYGSSGASGTGGFSWTSMVGYLMSVLTMLLIILMLVHYFIRPIFQVNPGGPGFIPIPGMNDNEVYWKVGAAAPPVKLLTTKIGTKSYNYSMTVDIMIMNPLQLGTENRVIFSRGLPVSSSNSEKPVFTIALLPTTTDMIITHVNLDNNEEPIVLPNIPIQTPFRLGIVIMDKAIEVYINGKLLKTRRLSASPKGGGDQFYPPQGSMSQMARVNNFMLWDRVLTAPEIRYATPALMTVNQADLSLVPTVSLCGDDDPLKKNQN